MLNPIGIYIFLSTYNHAKKLSAPGRKRISRMRSEGTRSSPRATMAARHAKCSVDQSVYFPLLQCTGRTGSSFSIVAVYLVRRRATARRRADHATDETRREQIPEIPAAAALTSCPMDDQRAIGMCPIPNDTSI